MIFPPCADFRLTFAFRVDRHADPAVPDGDVLWQLGKPDGHKQVAGGAGKVDDLQKIDDPKPPLRNKREDGGKQNAEGQNWGQVKPYRTFLVPSAFMTMPWTSSCKNR